MPKRSSKITDKIFFHRKQPIEQLVSKINESVSTFVINTDFPTINKRLTNMLISLSISFI
ncbi:hypothetical protein AB996_1091 [Lactococcus cremoris]|uniref:Uncharacterized protein n=1 Tax=Lactococcus lactis subsp. cremoris TaxID=1359 RepID=A0A166JSH3_LACLC|nr:hypothetical protein AB996_1091 [Lactococcus cremoris]